MTKRGRPSTGSAFVVRDKIVIQIKPLNDKRKRIVWDEGNPNNPIDLVRAKAAAAELQALANKGQWPPPVTAAPKPTGPEVFRVWVQRWLAERERRGLKSVRDDRGRMLNHVIPLLGDKPVADITREDVEQLVEKIDAKIINNHLSWKTAQNIWGLVTRAFADACGSKVKALRARFDNPALEVAPPDRGDVRSRAYLYPNEVLLLLSCASIPIRWRRLFAFAIYTAARRGEIEALEWTDVDLRVNTIHIHRSTDRETGEVRSTKTGETRRIKIEPALLPMLHMLRNASTSKTGRIMQLPQAEDLAAYLRVCLIRAGVTRAELFANDKTRAPITFHDLRATGITWRAIRGDDPIKIQRFAGHTTLATTQRYIREAESVDVSPDAVFPPLPEILATLLADKKEETPGTLSDSEGLAGDPNGI